MGKAVTFSVSIKYEDSRETEIFTFEKFGIDGDMDDTELKKVIDEVFQVWVWDKLNISYSILIDEKNAHSTNDIH